MGRLFFFVRLSRVLVFGGACLISGSLLAEGAVLDLRGVDFSARGGKRLRGNWELYWKHFLPVDPTHRGRKPTAIVSMAEFFDDHAVTRSTASVGWATYRITLLLPKDGRDFSLRIRGGASAHRLYWNGRLVSSLGRVSTRAGDHRAEVRPVLVGPVRADSSGRAEIVLHQSCFEQIRGGPGSLVLQPPTLAARERTGRQILDAIVAGAVGLIGLYHLVLFLGRPRDRAALWFALFCLGIVARALVINERLLNLDGSLPYSLQLRLEYGGWFVGIPMFLSFLAALYPGEQRRWVIRGLLGVSGVLILCLATPATWFTQLRVPVQYFTLAVALYCLFVLGLSLKRRRPGAYLMLPGWLVLFASIIIDIYFAGVINAGPIFITPVALVLFIFAQAGVLAGHFSASFRTVERLSGELERLNSVKDRFLANLSHELNTPLTTIVGYAEMLQDVSDVKTAHQMAAHVNSGAQALAEQLGDLFVLSRLESQGASPSAEKHDLAEILREVLAGVQDLAAEHEVHLDSKLISSAIVKGAEDQLERVFRNVLRNAILYNRPGGSVELAVNVRSDPPPGTVVVEITDTGIGIPPGDLPRVFGRFFRGDASDTYSVSGVGLGLFVARSITRHHGGTIAIESKRGKGTTVRIELPLSAQVSGTLAAAQPPRNGD